MILPSSCTADLRRCRKMVKCTKSDRENQVIGRRRYRRALERATRLIERDPERFDSEPFNVKRYTGWDVC